MHVSFKIVLVSLCVVLFTGLVFAAQENSFRKMSDVRIDSLVVDTSLNGLIDIQNKSKSGLSIESITVGGDTFAYSEPLAQKESKLFYVTGLTGVCTQKRAWDHRETPVVLSYTLTGQTTKTMAVSVNVDCVKKLYFPKNEIVVGKGTGTLTNPWVVNSCKELQNMNARLDGNYLLGATIDCTKTATWNTGAGFSPVGTLSKPFLGSLNGANHSIIGLTIQRPNAIDVGLFGVAQGTHMIARDITLVDANVVGSDFVGSYFGELTGATSSYTNLSFNGNFVYVWGTLESGATIGGGGGAYIGGDFPESFIYNTPDGQPLPLGQVSGDWGSIS